MNILGSLSIPDSVVDFDTSPELYNARSVVTTVIGGVTYVYVAGSGDDGIQILTMDANGSLTAIGTFVDTAGIFMNNPRIMDLVTVGSKQFLVVPGADVDGLTTLQIETTGPNVGQLLLADTIQTGGGNLLDYANYVKAFSTANGSYVAVSAYYSNAVSVYRIAGDGSMILIDQEADTGNVNFLLSGATGLSIHSIGNKTLLYVGSYTEDGVSIFELSATGQMSFVNSISVPGSAIESVLACNFNGQDVLIVGDYSQDDFVIYTLDANGVPTFASRFDAYVPDGNYDMYDIKKVTIDGVDFIVSLSAGSDRVMVYSLDDTGTMSLVTQIGDSLTLNGASYVTEVVIGDRHFLLVAAVDGCRITTVEIGGDDEVIGGTLGNDRMVGLSGDDDLIGRAGDDVIFGGRGYDVLSGRGGRDFLDGGVNDDVLIGDNGNDTLEGGHGADVLLGGLGYDNLSYGASNLGVSVNLMTGASTGGHATGDYFVGFEGIYGSRFDDVLTGDTASNKIDGDNGNDLIEGGFGFDTLNGQVGDDTLRGGAGNDRVYLGGGNDLGEGGDGRDNLFGSGGNDVMLGGAGDDTLRGQVGADTLEGGDGNDLLIGGGALDVFVFTDGFGTDEVQDFAVNVDRIDFSGLSTLNSFANVQAAMLQIGPDTYIIAAGNSIKLTGVTLGTLDAGDFIF